jgi:hypothetical protein
MTTFITLVKVLPELISFIRELVLAVKSGVEIIQIKRKLKAIEKTFANPDKRKAAEELDDIFRS